jgi:hypothetical protein
MAASGGKPQFGYVGYPRTLIALDFMNDGDQRELTESQSKKPRCVRFDCDGRMPKVWPEFLFVRWNPLHQRVLLLSQGDFHFLAFLRGRRPVRSPVEAVHVAHIA